MVVTYQAGPGLDAGKCQRLCVRRDVAAVVVVGPWSRDQRFGKHVRAFGYTVAARYLDNSEEMVRERYSHIEAGELGDVATEALDEVDR